MAVCKGPFGPIGMAKQKKKLDTVVKMGLGVFIGAFTLIWGGMFLTRPDRLDSSLQYWLPRRNRRGGSRAGLHERPRTGNADLSISERGACQRIRSDENPADDTR